MEIFALVFQNDRVGSLLIFPFCGMDCRVQAYVSLWQGVKWELTQRVKKSELVGTTEILVPVRHASCHILILCTEGICQK